MALRVTFWCVPLSLASCTSSPASAPPALIAPSDSGPAEEPDAPTSPVARSCYLDERAASKSATGGFRAPTRPYLGKCDKDTIDNLLACRKRSDEEAPNDPHCQALVSKKSCLACIFDDRGAILDMKFPNVAGCVALAMGDTSSDGCGAAYHDWHRCQKAGCASCTEQEPSVPGDLRACAEEAARTVCDARADFSRCDGLEDNADYDATCRQPEPITDEFLGRLMNYFCGTEGSD